jgi:hypothetical protein
MLLRRFWTRMKFLILAADDAVVGPSIPTRFFRETTNSTKTTIQIRLPQPPFQPLMNGIELALVIVHAGVYANR